VREVHRHMLGPEEADLIESDDSDKVRGGGVLCFANLSPVSGSNTATLIFMPYADM
jgi:hypothetical protein